MKVTSFSLVAILSYVFFWSSLASRGINNSAIYIVESGANGHMAGAVATMFTYVVGPAIVALLVWLVLYGVVRLISWPFAWFSKNYRSV
jgi:hypothetical protein